MQGPTVNLWGKYISIFCFKNHFYNLIFACEVYEAG